MYVIIIINVSTIQDKQNCGEKYFPFTRFLSSRLAGTIFVFGFEVMETVAVISSEYYRAMDLKISFFSSIYAGQRSPTFAQHKLGKKLLGKALSVRCARNIK